VKGEGRLTPVEAARTKLRAYRLLRENLEDIVRDASAAGMSQSEIARESGLSRQWVARILGGSARAGKDEK
jgi:predicted transcriptional regulator